MHRPFDGLLPRGGATTALATFMVAWKRSVADFEMYIVSTTANENRVSDPHISNGMTQKTIVVSSKVPRSPLR
jgi:hypothetical protein